MDGAYELLPGEEAVGHELAGAEGDRRAGLGVRHGWEMEAGRAAAGEGGGVGGARGARVNGGLAARKTLGEGEVDIYTVGFEVRVLLGTGWAVSETGHACGVVSAVVLSAQYGVDCPLLDK